MAVIMLLKQENYEEKSLRKAVEDIFSCFIDAQTPIRPGDSILLKPNLLSASSPDKRITTDPALVKSVAEAVLDRYGHPVIGDSPGLDRFASVAEKTKMNDIARQLQIPLVELTDPIPVNPGPQAKFHRIELARLALESHMIINIPKLKTHAQMLLTLGVKNLFGTVVGQQKASWHYNVGLNRDLFAELHLDIYEALHPVLTILDGIWGMEGHGPGNGTPRFFGLLGASSDTLALDFTICTLLGVNLVHFPLYRAAMRRGMNIKIEDAYFNREMPQAFSFDKVFIPNLDSLHLLPSFLDGISKRFLVSRPIQNRKLCIRCRKCETICAAKAITLDSYGKLSFDYNKCIRCFCCQEVCPNNAIEFQKGIILKILDLFKSRS
ncbi:MULTISPECIES: DUF362 domain-containing protein [Aminobacterium]|uniref:DUF362 domain-containing protein n=1 Tax=Aminobacterium TaxID=81466 RepID=UPI0025809F17|nr:DUF362 domain-containing protein [Aminobacterium sp. UBA4834]